MDGKPQDTLSLFELLSRDRPKRLDRSSKGPLCFQKFPREMRVATPIHRPLGCRFLATEELDDCKKQLHAPMRRQSSLLLRRGYGGCGEARCESRIAFRNARRRDSRQVSRVSLSRREREREPFACASPHSCDLCIGERVVPAARARAELHPAELSGGRDERVPHKNGARGSQLADPLAHLRARHASTRGARTLRRRRGLATDPSPKGGHVLERVSLSRVSLESLESLSLSLSRVSLVLSLSLVS